MRGFPSTLPDRGSPGVALIVTLMMMAVLVMMVVGLAGVMRSEQAASRNLTYQVTAEQLAEIGARQGMAAIASNSPSQSTPFFQATGPGWVLRDGTLVPLFSTQTNAGRKNLEEVGTNSLILSLTNTNRGSLFAGWSNISVTPTSPPIGRFAWWVDDEGGKLNVNYTSSNNARIIPWASSFPFQLDPIFEVSKRTTNRIQKLAQRTNWIFTAESLKDTNTTGLRATNPDEMIDAAIYRQIKGHVTAWGSNLNLNPYGQRKYSLTNLANPATILSNNNFDALMSATFRNSNLTNSSNFLTFQQNFELKYGGGNTNLGRLILRQAMANAYEALQPATSTNTTPPLTSATGTNIPTEFLALSPRSVLLNEVAVGAAAYVNNDELQIQVWVVPELVTAGTNINIPMDDSVRIVFTMPNNGITVLNGTKGGVRVGPFGEFYRPTSISNSPTRRQGFGNILTNEFRTNRTWACFEYYWTLNQGQPPLNIAGRTTELTIRVTVPDVVVQQRFGTSFVTMDWYRNTENTVFDFRYPGSEMVPYSKVGVPKPPPGPGDSFGANETNVSSLPPNMTFKSISKTDPRARAFSDWSNAATVWTTNITATPGLENTNIPLGNNRLGLVRDTMPSTISALREGKVFSFGTNFIWTNTNVPAPAWSATGTNFPSAGALGYIHTGLPWRTFRLSAQGTDPDPPDWLLLDLFSAGPATNPVPALNLNTQYRAMSPSGGVNDAPTFVTNRLPTVLSLFYSLTNTNIPAGFWSSAWNSTTLSNALTNLNSTNLSRWIGGSWWNRSRATATGVKTNPGLFLAGGELAEIRGVGDAGTTDADREAAMMAVGDLVSARSDTFSVWSIGQGLQVLTNAAGNPIRTNVLAEIRKQTVFQRVPQLNVNGDVTGYQMRVLYTRNHTVE